MDLLQVNIVLPPRLVGKVDSAGGEEISLVAKQTIIAEAGEKVDSVGDGILTLFQVNKTITAESRVIGDK